MSQCRPILPRTDELELTFYGPFGFTAVEQIGAIPGAGAYGMASYDPIGQRTDWVGALLETKRKVPLGSTLLLKVGVVVAGCAVLAACNTSKTASIDPKYGVAPSPRLIGSGQAVPKGGGRVMVGKPYKVAGKWYTPKEDPDYEATGKASWYGSAFHGRQTANGEIFDSRSITAAHTTMPLPSYARVTNVKNGRSIVVRVNDRGPFHGNRVIDVSQRTAEILGFRQDGIGQVKVAYVGPARLDGRDEDFLLASYKGPSSPSGNPRDEAPERNIQLASKDNSRSQGDRSQRVAPRREVTPPDSATGALLAYNDSQPRKQRSVPLHAGPPAIASNKRTPAPAARSEKPAETLPGVAASAPEPAPARSAAPAPAKAEPTHVEPLPPRKDPMSDLVEIASQDAAPESGAAPMVVASAEPAADADPIASRILAAYSSVGTSSGLDASAIAASAGKSGLAPIE